ncbi:MAG: hypothetical protein Q4D47_03135 [Erysipelotrichaceae bacterium]|nr:hypothetical protein [Erysipelotrichaceae bacterium]
MWFLFGSLAIIATFLNLIFYGQGKETKYLRFFALACTALTMCAFYSGSAQWILSKDYSALEDVVPTLSTYTWLMVGCSIFMNGLTLLKRK